MKCVNNCVSCLCVHTDSMYIDQVLFFSLPAVESAVVLHPQVAEAAAVGIEHPMKGQVLYVFVDLMQGTPCPPPPELDQELKAMVRKQVGAFATPDRFHYAPSGLPKTRSGKIMRRILRKVASLGPQVDRKDLGDTSTLSDPSVVDDLINSHADAKAKA